MMKKRTVVLVIVFLAGIARMPAQGLAQEGGRTGREIQELITDLGSANASVRDDAVDGLVEIGEKAVGDLCDVLLDGESIVRQGAAKALGRIKHPFAVDSL
ncbi:MAG: HEAT repeat domain-containing protein, partial [Planctomycetota bacterium]